MLIPMRSISKITEVKIHAYLKCGYSQKEIAKRLGVSLGTIKRRVQKARENRSFTPAKPGPRRALSSVQESIFVEMISDLGAQMTAVQLLQLWHRVTQRRMSRSTMRLHASRLNIRKPRVVVNKRQITEEESDALYRWWFKRLCTAYGQWLSTIIRNPVHFPPSISMHTGCE